MIHASPSPLAGKTVKLKPEVAEQLGGVEYRVEDWWDRVSGQSWGMSAGNPAALNYAVRIAAVGPLDDSVLYGKVGWFGHLVHVTEIETEPVRP